MTTTKQRLTLRTPDVNTDSASSAASVSQAGSANDVKPNPTGTTTASSAAGDVKPPTLKDVVQSVLDKHAGASSSEVQQEAVAANGLVPNENQTAEAAESNVGAEGATQVNEDTKAAEGSNTTTTTAKADDQPPVADENLPFGKHPRFRELIEQKRTFETKVKELEPVAQRMIQVEQFCQKHGVQPEDFNNAVQIAALIKTNPTEALKQVEQVVANLRYLTGAALPADLQAEVDSGAMSEAHAKEMLRLRVENHRAQRTTEQTTVTVNDRIQQEVRTSIDTWVSGKSATDPAFKPKASPEQPDGKFEFVNDRFMRLWQTEQPKSSAEVLKLAERAYADVTAFTQRLTPRTQVQRPPSPKRSAPEQQIKVDTSKPGWAKKVAAVALANR